MTTLAELVAAERAAQGLPAVPGDDALRKFIAAFDAVMADDSIGTPKAAAA